MRRINLKPIIASILGLTAIAIQTANIISGEIDDVDDSRIRIGIYDGDRVPEPEPAPLDPQFGEDLGDRIGRAMDSFSRGMEESVEGNPFEELRDELVIQYMTGEIDLPGFRETLRNHRVAVNAFMYGDTVHRRTAFLSLIKSGLKKWTLFSLLLLFGPWVVWSKGRGQPNRWALAKRSVPYFIASSAALLVLSAPMVDLVVGMQEFQIELASAGSPNITLTDATLRHLIHSDDVDLLALMGMLFEARETLESNPANALGLVEHLYVGAQLAQQSSIFRVARDSLAMVSRVVDLYGPILGIATLIIFIQIIIPIIKRLSLYPWQVVQGQQQPGAWPFLKDQLLLLWRIIRAGFWLFAFVLIFTLLAVAAVRLLSFPVASVSISGLLAAEVVLVEGGRLADVAVVLTAMSLALFLVLVSACCLGAMGVILARSYMVIWIRLNENRPFKQFPNYGRLVRKLMLRVFLVSLVCAALVFSIYWLIEMNVDSAAVRVWLPAPIFGPLLALFMWRLGVFKTLWAVSRLKVLALPTDTPGESSDEVDTSSESQAPSESQTTVS